MPPLRDYDMSAHSRTFGQCPSCDGVVFEQHTSGKHARLIGLTPQEFDALLRGAPFRELLEEFVRGTVVIPEWVARVKVALGSVDE